MPDVVSPTAELIAARLREVAEDARGQWQRKGGIRHCVIDALLPDALARSLGECFPEPAQMRLRNTFRERKYVCAQMNRHNADLETALFAFHAEPVLQRVRELTGKADLQADSQLYAGGISLMQRGHFLNPHIDNSHDISRQRWRNLNLLYYVTPESDDPGDGALELWPDGIHGEPTVIAARFNRLIIMETHDRA